MAAKSNLLAFVGILTLSAFGSALSKKNPLSSSGIYYSTSPESTCVFLTDERPWNFFTTTTAIGPQFEFVPLGGVNHVRFWATNSCEQAKIYFRL
jgi:hypothetical protein